MSLALAACGPRADGPLVLSGRIEAPLVDLAPKVPGRVKEVLVREGDRVKSGDLLVLLDLGESAIAVERDSAGVESARARLEDLRAGSRSTEIAAAEADVGDRKAAVDLARLELARQRSLLDQRVAAQRDFDLAKTALDRAAAALEASEQRLALAKEGSRSWQTEQARVDMGRAQAVLEQSKVVAAEAEIRAPADGVILHRLAEPGSLLGPSQPGLTMAFAGRLYVRTFIPETQLGRVRQGMKADVGVDAFPGKRFPARVTEISPDAEFTPKPVDTRGERVNLVYAAKVDLDSGWTEPLVPGQPAEVTIAGGEVAASEPGPP